MFQILRLGEKTVHEGKFMVDRPKGHPFYLLLLLHSRGRFFIDDEWQEVEPGTAFVFRPGQRHLYGYIEKDGTHSNYADSWIHIESDVPLLKEHFPYGKPVVLHDAQQYHSLFHLLASEYFGTAGNKREAVRHLLSALLCKLENEADTIAYPELYYQILELRAAIYSKPGTDWNIQKMAKQLNISEGYFHAIYKKYFGTTCIQDVIEARLTYACEYLGGTDKTVEEIAEICGYHNVEHFIRQFKKNMKQTPLQYRKSR